MSKSPDAFRTIREVADWLGVATHVLRFWESKFSQIRPVKRAGGRRYYRPEDMALVGGIKVLLHERGMTIKGVQRMIRDDGVAGIAALAPPFTDTQVPEELIEGIAEPDAWEADRRADLAEAEGEAAAPRMGEIAPFPPRERIAEEAPVDAPVPPADTVEEVQAELDLAAGTPAPPMSPPAEAEPTTPETALAEETGAEVVDAAPAPPETPPAPPVMEARAAAAVETPIHVALGRLAERGRAAPLPERSLSALRRLQQAMAMEADRL